MAEENLKFPATGLDSFTKNGLGVDLANIWNVINNLNPVAQDKNQVFTILGTVLGTPAAQLFFDLSIINASYPISTNIKISVLSLNFGIETPNPVPAFPFSFALVAYPTLLANITKGGFIVPLTTADQLIRVEMNTNIKIEQLIGDPVQNFIAYELPSTIQDFNQITPILSPVIRYSMGTSAEFENGFTPPMMIIEVETLD